MLRRLLDQIGVRSVVMLAPVAIDLGLIRLQQAGILVVRGHDCHVRSLTRLFLSL